MIKGTAIFVVNDDFEFIAGVRCNTPHYPGYLGLPGGKNDPGESDEQAILRETEEETGIVLASQDVIPLGKPITYEATQIICQWYYVLTNAKPTKTDGKVESWQRYSICKPPGNMMPGTEEKLIELCNLLGAK